MLIQISQRPATEAADLFDAFVACHQRIRDFLTLARRIAQQLHASAPEVIDAAQRVERYFSLAFPLHVADEELSLAPRLRQKTAELDRALRAMHEQHGGHRAPLELMLSTMKEVRSDPANVLLRRRLGVLVSELESELEAHLQLEESVLFPAARRWLSSEEQREILKELRERRKR